MQKKGHPCQTVCGRQDAAYNFVRAGKKANQSRCCSGDIRAGTVRGDHEKTPSDVSGGTFFVEFMGWKKRVR